MAKPTKGAAKVRSITDQVKLIDWLVGRLKAQEPQPMGVGEVRCFDCIVEEFRCGKFPDVSGCDWEYMEAVFANVRDQSEKVFCSPRIRELSAKVLAFAYQGNSGCPVMGAQYFIALLSDALKLEGQLLIAQTGETSRVTSTDRFRRRFGFRCDIWIEHGEDTYAA
ncbi:hypothetical protein [Mesorhizobium sp.]|uniref:hypothetical protein n=1 Tax=Mesorhizobium sp. TaxID=1871066 RepID=UPI00122AACAB|nr:hypothetical protein [Mesorhizobium sp.]TIM05493.1 MAG: hypothetical protein E5Y62_27255 [Mesorhizobium sp.]